MRGVSVPSVSQSRFRLFFAALALSLFSALNVAAATEFYAAPDGKTSGDGSINTPWDLQTALNHPPSLHPGDTIWLRGGTYRGSFKSLLNGSPTAPIIVRQFPGERATIDGGIDQTNAAILEVRGSDTWFWGFEIMSSYPTRTGYSGGSYTYVGRTQGVATYGRRDKFINLAIHDTSQGYGFWKDGVDNEIYGNLIYYNGWTATDRGHGHGIYAQNLDGKKVIAENILFQGFGYGLHLYGTNAGYEKNIELIGNIAFDNGYPSEGYNPNIYLAVGTGAEGIVYSENHSYYSPFAAETGYAEFGSQYYPSEKDAVITNNYFIRGLYAVDLWRWAKLVFRNNVAYSGAGIIAAFSPNDGQLPNWDIDANAYYGTGVFRYNGQNASFASFRSQTGKDGTSTLTPGRPTGTWAFVRPNKYEPGRAHIVVYNWDSMNQAAVDLSSANLQDGQEYRIVDAQNFFGPAIAGGTYRKSTPTVLVPLNMTAESQIVGQVDYPPVHTTSEFNVFVVLPADQQMPTQVQVPILSPSGGSFSAPIAVSMSSLTSGAAIRYTTDGSIPTSYSTLYSGPVTISSSLTLKARAFKSGLNDSDVAVGVYTIARDTTPPTITLAASSAITYSSARISWNTDEAADSQVDYGTSTSYGSSTALDSALATSHSQTLTGLTASTQYHYMVKSKDAAGNPATSSDLTFTTAAPPDLTPPAISAITICNITQIGATISWTTDEPASSRAEYGLTPAYGQQTALDSTLTTTHSVALTGLNAGTTYHLHVVSADASANPSISPDQIFTTLSVAAGLTTIRINSGGWGDNLADANGNLWVTDRYYLGGNPTYSSDIVGKIPEFGINATGRNGKDGDFSYHIPVTAGTYTVTLRFADPYYSSPGQRYFNVTINGQQVLTNFDVVAAAGYHLVTSRSYTATATSAGYLDIGFKGVLNGGLINGIEIVPFAAPMAAVPTIAPISGTYTDSVAVTMNCSTAGATIRYTTDGTEPGSGSPQYTGTLTFTSSVTIKAKAFATGLLDSPAASAVYTVVARDTTLPTISAVAVASISDTSATVTWTTDEPASSRVEYGLTAAYGQQTALDNTLTTTHSAALTGLGANTTYHLHVLSADGSGNASASSDQSFTTLAAIAGQTTLRINSGGWGDVVTDAGGNVWLPDRYYSGGNASYSSDIIGKAPEFGINATGRNGKDGDFSYHIPVTAGTYAVTLRFADPYYSRPGQRHFNVTINGQQVLTNFDVVAAAGYHLVTSQSFTATATSAGYVDISFKGILNGGLINGIEIVPFAAPMAATPTIAPVPGTYTDSVAVTMNCSTAGATIRYTTDGTEPGSGSPQYTGTLTFTSSVTIKAKAFATGLLDSPAASAVYTVVARDTTLPTISAVAVASISDTSATVTWTTNEPATSQVECGLTSAYGQQTALDSTLTTTHSVALTGLSGNTTYHLHVVSADGSGNASVSSDQSFSTLAAIAGQTTIRINSGGWGNNVTDANGNLWLTDRYYNGGNPSYSSDIIGNTAEFGINATGRDGKYGDFSYLIPVSAGTYTVTLRFADPYYFMGGLRLFNVSINGQQVLTNFDVVGAAGYHLVTSRSFTSAATADGYINIAFKGVLNGGLINGIEVVPK